MNMSDRPAFNRCPRQDLWRPTLESNLSGSGCEFRFRRGLSIPRLCILAAGGVHIKLTAASKSFCTRHYS